MGYIFFLVSFHRWCIQAKVMKEIRLFFFLADNNPDVIYNFGLATAFNDNFNLKFH